MASWTADSVWKRSRLKRVTLLACAAVAAGAGYAATAPVRKLQTPPAIAPSTRIEVESLGFRAPSRFYLAYRVPSATLDFIDDKHLLFTFHRSMLMRREEREPEEDEDQTIAALVLELPSGKVVERAEWRLHDKGRYLWAIGHGRFLERERNSLYLLDNSLSKRTLFLDAPGPIVAIQLSPDRSRMLIEYEDHSGLKSDAPVDPNAPTLGDVQRRTSHLVRMLVVETGHARVEHTAVLPHAVALPLVEGGYLDVEQGKNKSWQVRLRPFKGESRNVVQMTSSCQPTIEPLNGEVFMAQVCIPYTTDHLVQAYNLEGKKLWEQQWESRYVWSSFAYAENGSRFAYESIQLDHPITALDPVDETWITGQPVGVFDVADGTLRMVSGAEPILSAGQNFTLSGDGERFAVIRAGAIEVYKLPPAAVR